MFPAKRRDRRYNPEREQQHFGGKFYHFNNINRSERGLHLGLLRLCRQVCTETALIPYSHTKFIFESDAVRKAFEKSARPGKKRMQKQAVEKCEVLDWHTFYWREWRKTVTAEWKVRYAQSAELRAVCTAGVQALGGE